MAKTKNSLRSKKDLYSEGWTDRLIELALGEADEYGPSGHWFNTTGKPLFKANRVAIAAYRIGISDTEPDEHELRSFIGGELPSSLPIYTLDFHFLSNICVPGIGRKFWSARLSHPFAGRRPNSRNQEVELISETFIAWINKLDGLKLRTESDIEIHLEERAVSAWDKLESEWNNVCVRSLRHARRASKASSEKALIKGLDVLSLVHVGKVCSPSGSQMPLVETLIASPMLRFDRLSQ